MKLRDFLPTNWFSRAKVTQAGLLAAASLAPAAKPLPRPLFTKRVSLVARKKSRGLNPQARMAQFNRTLRALQRQGLGRYFPDGYLEHQLDHLHKFPNQIGRNIKRAAKRRRLAEMGRESRRINRCH